MLHHGKSKRSPFLHGQTPSPKWKQLPAPLAASFAFKSPLPWSCSWQLPWVCPLAAARNTQKPAKRADTVVTRMVQSRSSLGAAQSYAKQTNGWSPCSAVKLNCQISMFVKCLCIFRSLLDYLCNFRQLQKKPLKRWAIALEHPPGGKQETPSKRHGQGT